MARRPLSQEDLDLFGAIEGYEDDAGRITTREPSEEATAHGWIVRGGKRIPYVVVHRQRHNPQHRRRWTPSMVEEAEEDDKDPAERLQWIPRQGEPSDAQRRQRIPIMPGQNPKDPSEVEHVKTITEVRQILGKLKKADRCSDDCPGWAIFNESLGRPEIQVCDECMTALPKHLRLSDDDVAQLPEARRELKEAEARVMEDLDDDEIENTEREWQRPRGVPPGVPIPPGQNPRGAFSAKGERMYRDIKRHYRGDPRASEIAARTVYARAKEGIPGLLRKRR